MNNTANPQRVGVGLIGSQFIASIHAEALRACSQADVRAVASPTPGNALALRSGMAFPAISPIIARFWLCRTSIWWSWACQTTYIAR